MKLAPLVVPLGLSVGVAAGITLGPFLLSWGVALAPVAFVGVLIAAMVQGADGAEVKLTIWAVSSAALGFVAATAWLTWGFVETLLEGQVAVALSSLGTEDIGEAKTALLTRWVFMSLAGPVAWFGLWKFRRAARSTSPEAGAIG
jgi:hypothetical protein